MSTLTGVFDYYSHVVSHGTTQTGVGALVARREHGLVLGGDRVVAGYTESLSRTALINLLFTAHFIAGRAV